MAFDHSGQYLVVGGPVVKIYGQVRGKPGAVWNCKRSRFCVCLRLICIRTVRGTRLYALGK